uniref:NR LBD domain-containing protein n=1 Tax=Plectus sambesii TaxID=2011161 RepID=A0A914W0N8_9BILA
MFAELVASPNASLWEWKQLKFNQNEALSLEELKNLEKSQSVSRAKALLLYLTMLTSEEETSSLIKEQIIHNPGYLLDEVIELYHKLLDRRKFMLSDLKPLKSFFSKEQETSSHTQPFKLTRESEGRLRKREMALIIDFMHSLRPLSGFSPDDMFTLFKQFSGQFYFVEGCYRTYLNDGFKKNSLTMVTGEIVSLDNPDQFLERISGKMLDPATQKRLCDSLCIPAMRDLVEPMTVMKMTEREMLAFNLILLYRSQNATDLGFDQQNALIKAKNEVLDDLHQHYCDNNIEEGEVRLGTLILLIPAVLDWSYKRREHSLRARIFDFYNTDEVWNELHELH